MAVAFIANFMSVGTGFYVFNAFMQPLGSAYGWTRTDISLALSAGSLVGIFGQLIYGTLLVHVSTRVLMPCGALLAGLAFIQLGRVEELWLFYFYYLLLLLGNGAYGGIVANTAVNNWFVLKRGKAIGLATAGISLSGAILPFVALLLIENNGISEAFFWIGLGIIMVAPLAGAIMRDRPEQCGLHPDGAAAESVSHEKVPLPFAPSSVNGAILTDVFATKPFEESIWTPATVWKLPTFWKVGLAYAMVMVGVVGVLSQLKPRFTDIGFDDHAAMAMLTISALLGALGKYFWGMLCDRYDPRRVAAVLMVLGSVSLVFSFFEQSVPLLVIFVVVFGFSMGGVLSTFPIIIASLFGRNSFASVARVLALFFVLQMLGYPIASGSFDLTGSYNAAYTLFIVLDGFAAAVILSVKQPRPKEA